MSLRGGDGQAELGRPGARVAGEMWAGGRAFKQERSRAQLSVERGDEGSQKQETEYLSEKGRFILPAGAEHVSTGPSVGAGSAQRG